MLAPIKNLSIRRFKSVRDLSLVCRKVNLFIGAPDTGKTNILEALHFLSRLGWGLPLGDALRLGSEMGFEPLFFRQFLDQPMEIVLDSLNVSAKLVGPERRIALQLGSGSIGPIAFNSSIRQEQLAPVRYYAYVPPRQWSYDGATGAQLTVSPPHGQNLMYVARHDERVYEFLKENIVGPGWRVRFDQSAKRFVLSEVRGDEIIDYNLDLLSDSVSRLFFYGSILLTTESSVLVFDEPDVCAFPPYPKVLGEMIAADASNQFFLTTHNPYFLSAIVEKTRVEDLALLICYRGPDGDTRCKLLGSADIERVIAEGASVFFNLDAFLKK